jgi:two-component system phosphate regulon sensor histidine kinase PhoR
MTGEHILIIHNDLNVCDLLERSTLRPAGYEVRSVQDFAAAEVLTKTNPPDLIILGGAFISEDNRDWIASLLNRIPALPLIVLGEQGNTAQPIAAMRQGAQDFLSLPLRKNEVQQAVRRALDRRMHWLEWIRSESFRHTHPLQRRLTELETLDKIGRSVTSSLDLDSVLSTVVESAVALTEADEGSLLLLDETSGELYMRAGRNFQDDFVRTFRLPIKDTLAGQVIQSGKPIMLNEKTPEKIKTAYLVHTLIYVPLTVHGRTIGVLGVDNRTSEHNFLEHHLALVSAMADFAAIAIENASLFTRSELERNKLETILTKIQDGVIITDNDGRLILVNKAAREAFELDESSLAGKPVGRVFHNLDLLEILSQDKQAVPSHTEISLEDGRVFNALLTPIPEVGLALMMQDITHLKELDRIKSDFVNTVSHDLRSPLTAIQGYIELIERVGSLNTQQLEFTRRIQISVQNITNLVNDLLDLGRIEAGFDAGKEVVHLVAIINYVVENLRARIVEKNLNLVLDLPAELPAMFGNPIRLRQMVSNLVSNAIKYTSHRGEIKVSAHLEGPQIILQVKDNGVGIPTIDQPFIFDKFYRASNVPVQVGGSGLGLAIVKTIVEDHQGRIWVDSSPGVGSTFTVVLPLVNLD